MTSLDGNAKWRSPYLGAMLGVGGLLLVGLTARIWLSHSIQPPITEPVMHTVETVRHWGAWSQRVR